MPLKGACGQYLSPTVRNVYNKFSVRFFLRLVFTVATNVNHQLAVKKAAKNSDDDEVESSGEEDTAAQMEESDWEVLERQEAATTIESNFLEIMLTR